MDFFEAQDRAKRATWKLILLYLIAVVLIIASVYLVATILFGYTGDAPPGTTFFDQVWNPALFLVVSTIVVITILIGTLFRVAQLRKGGSAVAEMLGGRKVEPSTRDHLERRLVNVVEEMSIASGVPVPDLYILDREENINAFAAGFGTKDAAVGVTRGALEQLDRDELQGVIAHEFSHIINGDMRLNIRLIGILNGILLLHIMGMILMRSAVYSGAVRGGGGRGRGGGGNATIAIVLFGLALIIIGYIGMVFGRMIQAAISRQREYLADAAAVQYTRNPDGLAGALRKIGQTKKGGKIEDGHAMEMSHLFFANSFHSALDRVFSTHPPLEKRIRAIDPAHDAENVKKKERLKKRLEKDRIASAEADAAAGSSRGPQIIGDHPAITPELLLGAIGTMDGRQVGRAGKLLNEIPSTLREAAHEPLGAEALIIALLISGREERGDKSPDWLQAEAGDDMAGHVDNLLSELKKGDRKWLLPLAELALPSLRNMSSSQYSDFRSTAERLIKEDQNVSLFEFTLEKMIVRQLDSAFSESRTPKIRHHHLKSLGDELSVLLSAVAHASETNTEEAWKAGIRSIEQFLPNGVEFLSKDQTRLEELGIALEEMAASANPVKRYLLTAVIHAIASDGNVSTEEMELLRAISEALDCPMPLGLAG